MGANIHCKNTITQFFLHANRTRIHQPTAPGRVWRDARPGADRAGPIARAPRGCYDDARDRTCGGNWIGCETLVCGIAGVIGYNRTAIRCDILSRLDAALQHRGPDGRGFLSYRSPTQVHVAKNPDALPHGHVALVHRRLAIFDVSASGWQPMATPDGRAYIVFNGAIYNYRELRRELTARGCAFRSQSDTEVLLQAYVHFGPQVLTRLVGMFAFAILDTHTRSLFLARDAFGIKPLYYTSWRDGLAFASEIKPLLDLPGVRRQVHPQRLYRYLRFGVTDDGAQTLFAGIAQLPAAHYLHLSLDTPGFEPPQRYWSVPLDQTADVSFEQAAEHLRALFLDNIGLHLRSDVPVGAALSGGIDSSSIVTAMRDVEGPDLALETFSYVASSAALSEEAWADMAARCARATVHKTRPTPQDLVADLPHLIDVQGEPFGSTSIYAQMRVFRLARDTGIKVMLDGQGADELMGGYPPHVAAWLASLLRQGRWAAALRLLQRAPRAPGLTPRMLLARAAGLLGTASAGRGLSRRLLSHYLFPPWLQASWFEAHDVVAEPLWRAHGRQLLRDHLHQALTHQSLPMLLRYEDRNSMAFGIESRVPFLTPGLVSFIFTLPEAYLISTDGTSKCILRRAMRGLTPDAILDRRDKIGFATPERVWLEALQPWVEDVLNSETAKRIPALNLPAVQREWQGVIAGQKPFDNRCWRWLNAICWAAHFEVDCDG